MSLQEKTLPGCSPSPWKWSSNNPLQGELEKQQPIQQDPQLPGSPEIR